MKHPRYPEYKPSGVEWLGEVPAHWEVGCLKWIARFGYGDSLAAEERIDGNVPVYGSNGVVGTHDIANTKSPCLIVGRKGSYGKLVYSEEPSYAIDTTYYIDETKSKADLRWLYYSLSCLELDSNSKDSAVPGLAREEAYERLLACCSKEEQHAIAAFLDRETARIDALIEKKCRFIDLLQEKRAALISRAVTRGLDPNVSLKDSGVEWLGQIPAHWEVAPFKRVVGFQEGPGIMAYDFTESGVPLLRVTNVNGTTVSLDGCNYLDPIKVEHVWHHFRVNAGDLLISASASMGTVSEVGSDASGAIPYTGIIRLWPIAKKTVTQFVRYLVVSGGYMAQVQILKAGATIQHYGPAHLNQIIIVCPPLDEQIIIAAFLDRETDRIDALLSKVESAIEKLKEYRAALVAAAVTGKIDVRAG